MANSPRRNPYVGAIVDYGGVLAFAFAFYSRLRFVSGGPLLGWSLAIGGHGPRDLTSATLWLILGSVVGLAVGLIAERRVAMMPLITGVLAVVFGGLTLAFHDPRIIMFKPTAVCLLFALALFGGLALRRHPLKAMLGEHIAMPDAAWRTLSWRYGLFFLVMAGANELIRRTQSQATWLNFHAFGFTILAVLFSFSQVPLMMKYMQGAEPPAPPTE